MLFESVPIAEKSESLGRAYENVPIAENQKGSIVCMKVYLLQRN